MHTGVVQKSYLALELNQYIIIATFHVATEVNILYEEAG
jgi:hypothetical protein